MISPHGLWWKVDLSEGKYSLINRTDFTDREAEAIAKQLKVDYSSSYYGSSLRQVTIDGKEFYVSVSDTGSIGLPRDKRSTAVRTNDKTRLRGY